MLIATSKDSRITVRFPCSLRADDSARPSDVKGRVAIATSPEPVDLLAGGRAAFFKLRPRSHTGGACDYLRTARLLQRMEDRETSDRSLYELHASERELHLVSVNKTWASVAEKFGGRAI